MSRLAILAVYRPVEDRIAVFVDDGPRHSSTELALDEARALYGALGNALMLADSRGEPIAAVPGAAS